jgi:hypothetical protein
VERARRDGKFRGPVIGPIGASLKVAPGKEEFAEIAETALGRVLDKFIVTNDADSKLLRQIRETARCQQECGVYRVAVSARYNIPPPPSGDGLETVASVLTIDDDIVFNCLVDNAVGTCAGFSMKDLHVLIAIYSYRALIKRSWVEARSKLSVHYYLRKRTGRTPFEEKSRRCISFPKAIVGLW